jgi:hypothetical protein
MTARYYFVFDSRNQAIYMETMLKAKGYRVELKPTPGRLGKGCSSSLAVYGQPIEIKNMRNLILSYRMSVKGIYKAIQTGQFTDYDKVY